MTNANDRNRISNYKALLLVRVSSTKQRQESDSPEIQIERGMACANNRFGIEASEVMVLSETYSGRAEERPQLDQAFAMVQQFGFKYLFFFDIDRPTRAGPAFYENTKKEFYSAGCQLIDVKGIIQPEQNSLEGTGGELGMDFTYEWSVYAPSEKAEVMEAQAAKDDARKILSRTIPVQIRNAQKGRANRPSRYGYKNVHIVDESGKPQPTLDIVEEEAFFIRKIFTDKAAGLDNRLICDRVNQLGFQTRIFSRWSKDHSHIVAKSGGNPMNTHLLRNTLASPIYAGFFAEKWTHWLPVQAKHPAIIDLDLWNAANRASKQLVKDPLSQTGWSLNDVTDLKRRSYLREREDFPLKNQVICQVCHHPLKAAYSRGKAGTRFGYYFCTRSHKRVSMSSKKLEEAFVAYCKDLRFTPEATQKLERKIRSVWAEKASNLNKHLLSISEETTRLREEAASLIEKIKLASSQLVIAQLEQEYEDLHARISKLESHRNDAEIGEDKLQEIINWAKYLVEHLDQLLVGPQDPALKKVFWSLVFVQTPTLEELQNRTHQLSPLVRLGQDFERDEVSLVTLDDAKSNSLYKELIRWADRVQDSDFPRLYKFMS